MLSVLTWIVVLGIAIGGLVWGLALHWSYTPHGRLKPIFALAFKLAGWLARGESGNELGTREMGSPALRAGARANFLKSTAPLAKKLAFSGRIEERRVPGPGGEIPVRIYTPRGSGPFPLIVYLHGGGFVVGSIDYTDGVTRALAARTPALVISVEYRLAPEAPYPAALDDACAVVAWALAEATHLGARPGPLCVAGDSAGGNLAAAVALRDVAAARAEIALQVLIYPALDASNTARGSYQAFARGYGLTTQSVEEAIALYAPDPATRRDPLVSPLLAASLVGLAPAFVISAGFDVLRDEGLEYAQRLEKAGVRVRHLHEPHLPHGYITMSRLCREAAASIDEIAAEVRAVAAAGPG